jgi:hypothetical protein
MHNTLEPFLQFCPIYFDGAAYIRAYGISNMELDVRGTSLWLIRHN